MNTRRVVLTIFAVLIALGISIPGVNAQPESVLHLLLPGVDENGNLTSAGGVYCETKSVGSENKELIICHGEVTNLSGKAYVENPYIIDINGCCVIGPLVISASGQAHILGEFQCPCE